MGVTPPPGVTDSSAMSGEQFSLVVSSAPSFSLRATGGLFVLSVGLCADGLG
jgi:hypothetical protein